MDSPHLLFYSSFAERIYFEIYFETNYHNQIGEFNEQPTD